MNGTDSSYSVSLAYPPTADPVEYVTLPKDMTLEQVCIKVCVCVCVSNLTQPPHLPESSASALS